jgi:hypothetical protein
MWKALFVGIRQSRVSGLVASVHKASGLRLDPTVISGLRTADRVDLGTYRAVFVSRDIKQAELIEMLDGIRRTHPALPVVLVYGASPDGRAFLLSNRFGCMLYSELDRFGRTLTGQELAEALQATVSEGDVIRKMMELSMCSGPCSTG